MSDNSSFDTRIGDVGFTIDEGGRVLKNRILTRISKGQVALGCQLAFPCAPLVEVMGIGNLDFVLLDGEHGTFTWESLEEMCRTAELAGLTAIARVPNIEASTILRYLDRGVQGILGPGVDTREEAQQLVDACYYAPIGRRGLGGAPRAARYVHMADRSYLDAANSQMFVAAFLEHAEALEQVEEIASVEGIHALYVGPQDLSVSLGLGGQPQHPRIEQAQTRVREAAHAAGKHYLQDMLKADRATNYFLSGLRHSLGLPGDRG